MPLSIRGERGVSGPSQDAAPAVVPQKQGRVCPWSDDCDVVRFISGSASRCTNGLEPTSLVLHK